MNLVFLLLLVRVAHYLLVTALGKSRLSQENIVLQNML